MAAGTAPCSAGMLLCAREAEAEVVMTQGHLRKLLVRRPLERRSPNAEQEKAL